MKQRRIIHHLPSARFSRGFYLQAKVSPLKTASGESLLTKLNWRGDWNKNFHGAKFLKKHSVGRERLLGTREHTILRSTTPDPHFICYNRSLPLVPSTLTQKYAPASLRLGEYWPIRRHHIIDGGTSQGHRQGAAGATCPGPQALRSLTTPNTSRSGGLIK